MTCNKPHTCKFLHFNFAENWFGWFLKAAFPIWSQNTICTPMESQTPPLSSASKEQTTKEELNIQFQTPKSSSSSPFSAVVNIRLWGPAAQRNLRNQWSKLASLWQDWQSCSSATRSQATTLVNSYLSQKYSKKPAFINILNNIQKIFY